MEKCLIILYLSIWLDSKSIVWDSSVVFADKSDQLALGLTRFLLNNRECKLFCIYVMKYYIKNGIWWSGSRKFYCNRIGSAMSQVGL